MDKSVVENKKPLLNRLTLWAVARSSALVILGLLLRRASNILVRVVLGRALGPEDLGVISTVWSWTTTLGVVGVVGLTPTVTRFLALYLQRAERDAAYALITESFVWVVLVTCGLTSLVIGFAPAIATRWLGGVALTPLVRMGAFAIPAWALLLWMVAVFRGLGETVSSLLTRDVSKMILALGSLAILWWSAALNVTTAVLFLYVVPTWFGCAIGIMLLWTRIRGILQRAKYHAERRDWILFAWPLSLSMFLQNTSGRSIDILVLGYLASTEDVGLYVSALSLVGLLGLLLQGVNYLALPLFTGSAEQIKSRQMQQIRMLTFELTLPVSLAILLWPGTITHFTYGDAFAKAVFSIPVLTIGYAVSNFFGPVGQRLLAEGKTRWHLLADIVSIAAFLGLAFALVPILGVLGAATARSFSQATFNITAYLPYKKQSRLWGRRLWVDIGGAILIAGLAKTLTSTLANNITEIEIALFLVTGTLIGYLWLTFRWWNLLLRMQDRR